MTLSSTHAVRPGTTFARPAPGRLGEQENLDREIWLSRAGMLLTVVAFAAFVGLDLPGLPSGGILTALYLLLVSGLVYGGLVYQVARLSCLRRLRTYGGPAAARAVPVSDASVVILVPSYKEEPAIVRQTLMSAALQDHPRRRVVLLIDDPPDPADPRDRGLLEAMRRLPEQIGAELAEPAADFTAARQQFEQRAEGAHIDPMIEASTVAASYERAAAWLSDLAGRWSVHTHADRAFVDWILAGPAEHHRATAHELRRRVRDGSVPGVDELSLHHRRLAWMFDVELGVFERKRCPNLSHEPNKAMNLNSYISLLGSSVDDAEYVLTLDADSIVLPEYTRTLLEVMERPENGRVAVAQTPYSAFPGAPGPLERLAGATTDMQYIVHQGFTAHQATYWVGANALLRKSALEDIATCEREGPIEVRRYIQDRTVIEDTESSIDLVRRGGRFTTIRSAWPSARRRPITVPSSSRGAAGRMAV